MKLPWRKRTSAEWEVLRLQNRISSLEFEVRQLRRVNESLRRGQSIAAAQQEARLRARRER